MKNILISQRAEETSLSPIRKLYPYAERAKKRGIKVYHLNIGQPDLPTPRIFFQKIKKFSTKTLAYGPSKGFRETRIAFKKYYAKHGIKFSEEEILITTGGSEAILFALTASCDPGQEVIVFEPFYSNYQILAQILGIKVVAIPLKIETGFHLPDSEEIEKKITSRTRAIIVCNPSNPTGTVYSREELSRITRIAKKFKLFIIADEVYREIVFDQNKFLSLMSFPQVSNQVILVDSLSKRFNLCGARIGCLASKNNRIIESGIKFAQGRLSAPVLEQLAGIPLLENHQKFIHPLVKEYQRRRDIVFKALKTIPGVICQEPEGAFYIMAGLPVEDAEDFSQWLLEKFDLDGETVMFAPGGGFYTSKNLGQNEVRIAFVLKSSELKRAMEVLKVSLKKYRKLKD